MLQRVVPVCRELKGCNCCICVENVKEFAMVVSVCKERPKEVAMVFSVCRDLK